MNRFTIKDSELEGLADKVIIITGASSGIGLETAKLFLSLGAKVVNGDLNPPAVALDNDNLVFVPTDVTSWAQLSNLFEGTYRLHGRIDHVFANAGIGPTADYLTDIFDANGVLLEPSSLTLDINLKAVVNTAYLAIHYMKKQASGGSIVINSSATAFQPFRAVDYSVAKHGVLGLVRGLAPVTYPGLPIRINGVAPDWTSSSIVNEILQEVLASTGGSFQPPLAVAKSVALLMADASRHGQVLYSKDSEFTEIEKILLGAVPGICGNGPTLDSTMASYIEHMTAAVPEVQQ